MSSLLWLLGCGVSFVLGAFGWAMLTVFVWHGQPYEYIARLLRTFASASRQRSVLVRINDDRAIQNAPPDLLEVPFEVIATSIERRHLIAEDAPRQALVSDVKGLVH